MWIKGSADGGAPVIDYRISSDQSVNTYVVLASNVIPNQYTASGLTFGNTYKLRVEARNTFGYSAYS